MRVGILPEWAGGASVPAAKQNSTSYPSLLVTEAGPGTFPPFCHLSDTGSCFVFWLRFDAFTRRNSDFHGGPDALTARRGSC